MICGTSGFLFYYMLLFAVLMETIRILFSSVHSFAIGSPISMVVYSDSRSSRSRYSVSAGSFSAICSFETKSALLCPQYASLMSAPMPVPLRRICLEIMDSFCVLTRYLWSLMICAAKAIYQQVYSRA